MGLLGVVVQRKNKQIVLLFLHNMKCNNKLIDIRRKAFMA